MRTLQLNRRGMQRVAATLLLFIPLFTATYIVSYLLRFAGDPTSVYLSRLLATLPWVLAVKLSTIAWFKLHQSWCRYVTFHDMLVVVQALSCASIAIIVVDTFLLSGLTIPRSIVLLDWGCTLVAVGAVWGLPRLLRDGGWQIFAQPVGTRALIVGANDSGEGLLRAIRRTARLGYQPVGFVDDRPELQGCRISGIPVVGRAIEVAELARKYRAQEVLITAGELTGKEVRKLVDTASQESFRVKVLPSVEQLLREDVAIQPRPVSIEDLLQRPSIDLDLAGIRQWISGKTVLVTGSAGSIGSEISRQLLKLSPEKMVLVDRSETGQFFMEREMLRLRQNTQIETCLADITDRARVDAVFREHHVDIVFHAAAYKHVPLMEEHPGEAVKNITLATRHLVDLANEHDVTAFVMISTDKAVNPTSIMGSCKQLAEQYVQARAATSNCRLVTVRFGNVLDSAGSVIPIFREQIARGGPVTVTHPDMIRYFMLIPEAAQLVIQAGAMGQGGEIFVLDMGEPVKICDLAHDMIRLSGLRVGHDIEVEFTGLRPGEKLYEELYGEGEQHRQTAHAKILVAQGKQPDLFQVNQDLRQLEKIVDLSPDFIRNAVRKVTCGVPVAGAMPKRIAA
ncbi:MAG: polysaccharide biosynthesis protein [Pirellulales bacterium]|nr:polysaccharide biosynthesis protein [Pirellulales bacterium]